MTKRHTPDDKMTVVTSRALVLPVQEDPPAVSQTVATKRRSASASRTLAEQFKPIVSLHTAVRNRVRADIDVAHARTRIRAGRYAYDAANVLSSAGDLSAAFERTAVALEDTGIASTPELAALKRRSFDPQTLILRWATSDAIPRDATLRLARQVAGIVGNAVLDRATQQVVDGFSLSVWKRTDCPCCGASPDLALASEKRRTLVCWRCNAMWRTAQRGCLGCGAVHPPTLARVASPHLSYELAICNSCGRYLKERRGSPTYDLLIERALTTTLDEAAQERGLRT